MNKGNNNIPDEYVDVDIQKSDGKFTALNQMIQDEDVDQPIDEDEESGYSKEEYDEIVNVEDDDGESNDNAFE